jgi:outer membrane receptor for monomeric catechols
MIVVAAVCCCGGGFSAAAQQPRLAPASDTAAPYKANRLSSPRASEPILNTPGQTTVLTREVLDDMKATSLKDALRSTAGVTIGR